MVTKVNFVRIGRAIGPGRILIQACLRRQDTSGVDTLAVLSEIVIAADKGGIILDVVCAVVP